MKQRSDAERMREALAGYRSVLQRCRTPAQRRQASAALAERDLFFFIRFVLMREDIEHPWLFARCREWQRDNDNVLDLWAREHYKSSIGTHGGIPWGIIQDPERTYGIFSFTRPIAKGFLRQIKTECETNPKLYELWPHIFWRDPKREAPKWSEDDGLVFKRRGNPKEASIEAWGIVDGQPTSKHFSDLDYEDPVTIDTVRTPGMIRKTIDAMQVSYNLGMKGGRRRFRGTRWHYADPWQTVLETGVARPRIYPATVDGTETGEPVLWTREHLAQKIRELGPYNAACHCAGTRILMGDWTLRPVEQVRAGDRVIGFEVADGHHRTRLVVTEVLASRARRAVANEYLLESGHILRCTPDHMWWTGRTGSDTHAVYRPLGDGSGGRRGGPARIVDLDVAPARRQQRAWDYLAGMFDGEGTCGSMGNMVITQSERHHPEVCERIRETLRVLDLPFVEYRRKAKPWQIMFRINAKRVGKWKLLRFGNPAKRAQITRSMLGAKSGGKGTVDRVDQVRCLGHRIVYNIQTGTGNYVAEGYGSKNCQLFLDPKQSSMEGFRKEWLRYWRADRLSGLNVYILGDPANSKKHDSDYTCFWVIGLGADRNYYIINGLRDRLSLTERANVLFKWHQQYRPVQVGYEQYGMQADIEHFEDRMRRDNYRFSITALGGKLSKPERIGRLVAPFSGGRIFLPESLPYTQYDGTVIDVSRTFVEEEYLAHPFEVHDDMLDCLARILDEELSAVFPAGRAHDPLELGVTLARREEYDPLRWGTGRQR